MAIKLVSRSAWGARASKGSSALSSTRGVKVHYTGASENPRMLDDHSLCDNRVRGIQADHMDGNRWNDIGYSAVVCPHGYVFVGRGPHRLPAANGEGLNSGHYAVCGLVGNKGITKPTDKMLDGIRDAIEWLRDKGDAGNEIKGHRDGYSTDCPGTALYAWVKKGAPRPGAQQPPPPKPVPTPPWPGRLLRNKTPLMHGPDVLTWQKKMKARGWPITTDGFYGPASAGTCRTFQQDSTAHGWPLVIDGRVGELTWVAAFKRPVS